MQSHIRKVYACLAATCHLHFWQNDQDLLRSTAVTQEWNRYRTLYVLMCSCLLLAAWSRDSSRFTRLNTCCMMASCRRSSRPWAERKHSNFKFVVRLCPISQNPEVLTMLGEMVACSSTSSPLKLAFFLTVCVFWSSIPPGFRFNPLTECLQWPCSNAHPQSSQLAKPPWPDPDIKSDCLDIIACRLICTKTKTNNNKRERRQGIIFKRLPHKPCTWGKFQHHWPWPAAFCPPHQSSDKWWFWAGWRLQPGGTTAGSLPLTLCYCSYSLGQPETRCMNVAIWDKLGSDWHLRPAGTMAGNLPLTLCYCISYVTVATAGADWHLQPGETIAGNLPLTLCYCISYVTVATAGADWHLQPGETMAGNLPLTLCYSLCYCSYSWGRLTPPARWNNGW